MSRPDKVLEIAALLGARSCDAKDAEFTYQHLPKCEIRSFATLRVLRTVGPRPGLDMVGKIVNAAGTSWGGVRVWHLMSCCSGPRTGRPPTEGLMLATLTPQKGRDQPRIRLME
jgi:hypothetical protein